MNSTNDLPQHFIYTSPTRISSNYDYPDDIKSPKKDKKWTISSLFRRKKKDGGAGSDGGSSDDEKKNFLGRRRKKSETKRRKSKPSATFDHIVMPRQLNHDYVNDNTFSEPQRFTSWNLQKSESELLNGNLRSGSADSLAKRSRKELTKARAEARRTTYRKESSSDEDSSHISGSSLKIRSEENLRQRDSSLSKRSRSARTERYLKRHSKDGENPYNYIKLSDESNRSLSRSPLLPISQKNKSSYTSLNSQASSYSGLSTIPPSHTSCSRYRVSNSTENPSYKPPLSMNEYNNSLKKYDNNFNSQRSISCDANIHRAPSNEFNANVMHVQLPIVNLRHRNLSLIDANQIRNARQAPPPPPPRDPSRLVTAHYFETGRPNTYYFENRSKSFNQPSLNRNSASIQKNYRSTSEDQLLNDRQNVQNIVRPSSTTPEVKKETFYLTDKNPRSRKPIQINTEYGSAGVRKAADFWKQLDRDKQIQEKNRRSPQMFTCQTHVQNQVFLPSVLQNDINIDNVKLESDNISKTKNTESIAIDKPNIAVDQQELISDDIEEKRKSSNLEDALNELEAIFNSLGLGDEDLIDRAEQREKEFVNKQLLEGKVLPYGRSNGVLSDSNFTYEPFDTVDTPKMNRRFGKKSRTIDRKNDDMASRQMDKRRSHTISDPQSMVISYLNIPPFNSLEDDSVELDSSEVPNIVTDDVVYKKLKHSCNSLKLPDNQPPFGIPLGPITVAANSDYLHATPRNTRHKQRKIPDLVTDDLAFRNLRKDFNKEPALPPLTSDDFKNNNNSQEQNYLAKRKAVRSLSANIGSLMSQEVIDRARCKIKTDNNNGHNTIMDTADAMEIARNVLKEKNQRITDTRKAFMSDTDANYSYERNNNDLVKESRKNFLNGLRNHDNNLLGDELLTSKPPHGLSPDRRPSKSPINHSSNSSLDELINTLSEEAKETNERIANELKLLEKQRSSSLKVDELDFERTDTLNRTLNEIDAVSEHAKLCEKLLECVVDSTELISSTKTPVEEEVEQIDTESDAVKLVANEVVTRSDSKLSENKSESPISHKSEHDYENLVSDTELNIDEIPIINDVEDDNKCKSPFEEHKAELIDSFQKLKHNMEDIDDVLKRSQESKKDSVYDNVSEKAGNTDNKIEFQQRPNLPRWLRSRSCETISINQTNNFNNNMSEGQEGRAERIARYKEERRKQLAAQFGIKHNGDDNINRISKKDGPSSSSPQTVSTMGISDGVRSTRTSRLRAAAKLQDNLASQRNSLQLSSDTLSTVSGSEARTPPSRRPDKDKSHRRKSNLNRSLNSEEVPPSPNELNDDTRSRRRRRRMFTPDILELSQKDSITNVKSDTARNVTASHPPEILNSSSAVQSSNSNSNTAVSNKPTTTLTPSKKSELSVHMENARKGVQPSYSEIGKYRPFNKRSSPRSPKPLETQSDKELNYTRHSNKENLEKRNDVQKISMSDTDKRVHDKSLVKRMQGVTSMTHDTLARVEKLINKKKDSKLELNKNSNSPIKQFDERPSSILKKKSIEENLIVIESNCNINPPPVSILKRKINQDEHSTTNTPPVTFSPNVVEPQPNKKKQGILKKRRSLDESQVMRHRSCSPDVAIIKSDSRSILKNQRRSSLEELTRIESPEVPLQGILKRRTSRCTDDDDHSLNSPQSILKRRSGASSAGSTSSTPHVSITTAVILAAAGGAEMVLESDNELVKPILKKKSSSEEHTNSESLSEVPKPILKKKSSTDTDDCDDKPRPILKQSRNSYDEYVKLPTSSNSDIDCDVKPILKLTTNCNRDTQVRTNRLSFCATEYTSSDNLDENVRHRSRRSNTICSDFQFIKQSSMSEKEEDRSIKKARPLSVHDLVMSFEKTSTGAIPKQRMAQKRNSNRYKTQPVTSMELEASLNSIKSPTADTTNQSVPSLVNLTSALNNENNLSTFLPCSFQEISTDSGICGKMSSDSAFQSLGDGLELEQDDNEVKSSDVPLIHSKANRLEQSKLELQMKAIADEAKKLTLNKGGVGSERFKSRKNDKEACSSRFFERKLSKDSDDSEDDSEPRSSSEKRGILKNERNKSVNKPKSVLKTRNRQKSSPNRRSILKTDTYDEGISCNDSGSDTETNVPIIKCDKVVDCDSTSDGESSGGREVKNIFKNDSKFKNALEIALSKSRSQCEIEAISGNESINEKKNRKTNLRRSHTHSEAVMPRNIAEIRAKLQQNGENEWKKRIAQNNNATNELKLLTEKNRYNDELSEKSLLESKKDELDVAAKQWKSRVEKSDAEKFTVAGRMEKSRDRTPTIDLPEKTETKRRPQAKRFKGKESSSESSSTPVSPEKNCTFDLNRSKSISESTGLKQDSDSDSSVINVGRTVIVPKPDDFTFTKFYESVERQITDPIDLSTEDFDYVPRQQSLLVLKKNVQVQKRRMVSRNPIKALGNRTDISNEYYEIKTGVAEREKKRLNIEKLAQNSNFAIEALAGLASKEDFKSVALKKGSGSTDLQPYKDLMLLQVKGRRHVQTRLIEPVSNSINEGDNFLLVTPTVLYNYIGEYSNIIEQSRAADIANVIQKTRDLGCKVKEIIILTKNSNNKHLKHFWSLLGENDIVESVNAGEINEDENYEADILSTNMIYQIGDNELVPVEEYWGSIPKYDLLEERKVFVFDFGTEMYVWSGKNASNDEKKLALQLAKQLWNEGYNYTECEICPLNIAAILGERDNVEINKTADKRPDWALFAKITQHRETVLFKEKFLDWPDFSRVIRVRSDDKMNPNIHTEIFPYNVTEMLKRNDSEPDLVIEGVHLGRGQTYFDEETRRFFKYDTIDLEGWRVLDNASCESLESNSLGQFYDQDSYIYSWRYRMTVQGRELNGQPSKHAQVGKERCVFFCWQGANSSVNEKCTAAFLTVQLDTQNAPQIRIEQGNEPAAFLHLFKGAMVVHEGKRGQEKDSRLFIIRGELENEGYLMEVPCTMESLRSRSSFFLINLDKNQMILWHGCKSTKQKRRVLKCTVENLMKLKADELFMDFNTDNGFIELEEGSETDDFFDLIGDNDRNLYQSLLENPENFHYTLRMFHMTSITGTFIANEVLCLHRSEYSSPFPFVQFKLYSASQPALFLIDNKTELWIWQGWWPEEDVENNPIEQKTGSGIVRWQSERKAAMQTAINYWKSLHEGDEHVPAYLVWAGLEPLEFKNLFPRWTDVENVTELNLKEGRIIGEKVSLEMELSLLSRTTYKLEELLQRPLPNGVDPTHLERYLSAKDFEELLLMSKEEFEKLPSWKKTTLKKEKGLF